MTTPDSEAGSAAGRAAARDEIRQLVAQHALYVDSRDVEGLVSLFSEAIDTATPRSVASAAPNPGRSALKESAVRTLRGFGPSFHFIGTHVIDFQDDDHATGHVYCIANEHGGRFHREGWAALHLIYSDVYVRESGTWLFGRMRTHQSVFTDTYDQERIERVRTVGIEPFLPEAWTTWNEFWSKSELKPLPT